MDKPIEVMLDSIEWRERPKPASVKDGDLYATHEGTLTMFGKELKCYTLNNGMRVFEAESLERFFSE